MGEGKVKANGVQIWYETFGRPADPAVLLIMGAGAQATAWRPEFCGRLVAGGRHVIRFDNRDVGLSQWFANDESYTLHDMADDTVGLMDALRIDRAHLVGASLGGMIGQVVTIRHPERVLTLTSMLSSPSTSSDSGFEPPEPKVLEEMLKAGSNVAESREDRIAQRMRLSRAVAGTRYPFDEEWWREVLAESVDRAWRPEALAHHAAAIGATPSRLEALRNVAVPTFVIHGTADPLVPYSHAVATAEAIPGAKLLAIEGLGHELPPGCWDEVIAAILDHTS